MDVAVLESLMLLLSNFNNVLVHPARLGWDHVFVQSRSGYA